MAKFCANCGAPMEDGDVVCGQCGTPVSNVVKDKKEQKATGEGGNNKKLGIAVAVGCAVVVIAVIAVIANVIGGGSGYKSTLNTMVKAIKNNDSTTIVSISSSISEDIYKSEDYDKMIDRFLDNKLDSYEDRIDGEVKKITYEIKDKSEVTDRKLEKYKDKLSDDYNVDTNGITKMIKIDKLKLTVKGRKKSSSDSIEGLYLIKENGKWTIFFDDYGIFR
nr:zinc ribbon domain-containing protein [uncultured Lachnoanaerobaculum sp.]